MEKCSSFNIRVSNSITETNKNDWDALFPQIPENYNFFRTIEETLSQQFKLYYITIYEGAELVCAAPCFIMDYSLDTTVEGPLKKFLAWLQRKAPQLFMFRVLICGCPMAEGRIGLKNPSRCDLIKALLDQMRSLSKKESASLIAFKDFSEAYLTHFQSILREGFHTMRNYPATELDMRFRSFEEYLASLSRVTRKGIKKKLKQVEQKTKIELEVTNTVDGSLDEVYALYLNTLNKSEVQFEKLTKEFFVKLSRNMPQETKYFLWRIDGKLAAFDLCLASCGILIDEYIGLDYKVAYQYHLYYVTFRDIFCWCLKNGIHTFQGGTLNYDPKKRLDFKFLPQYIFVKHKNIFMNFVFGILCKILKPENFDPVLKRMRNTKSSFFWKVFALIFLADTAEAVADLFFKRGTFVTGINNVTPQNFLRFTLGLLCTPHLWVGIFFYFFNFLLWIVALSKVDLSVAFPMGSTTFVIVPLLAMIFLHEKVVLTQWLGILCIIIGVFFLSKSTENKPA